MSMPSLYFGSCVVVRLSQPFRGHAAAHLIQALLLLPAFFFVVESSGRWQRVFALSR